VEPEQLLTVIKTRRSVRAFEARPVDDEMIDAILEAGRWAPSGLNNQPWRFCVVRDAGLKEKLAGLTHYGKTVLSADILLPVFVHGPSMYNPMKDHQAIGACLQNMLLMAHGLGLGAVWLGEILKSAGQVRRLLKVDGDHELMAMIALGWPRKTPPTKSRQSLEEMILGRF
jgi:nitroreductase